MDMEKIPIEEISFVRLYFANIYRDPTHVSHSTVISEYFFSSEIAYNSFINNVKYPMVVRDKGYKIAIQIGKSYHPLGAPICFNN
jgi:hypothetical protein